MDNLPSHVEQISAVLPRFDVPVEGLFDYQLAALGFAHRAIDLARAAEREADQSTIAASVLLRTLADLLILVRWIEPCPKLHTRLWIYDGGIRRIEASDSLRASRLEQGRQYPETFTAKDRADARRRFERMRAFAKAHGIRPASDSLLPTIRDRARKTPGLEDELYGGGMAGYLSPAAHTGIASFDPVLIEDDGRRRLRLQDPIVPDATRALTRSLLCGILSSISRQLGLGLEGDLERIRLEIMAAADTEPWDPTG